MKTRWALLLLICCAMSSAFAADPVPGKGKLLVATELVRGSDFEESVILLVRFDENGATPPPSVPSGGLEPWPFGAEGAYEVLGNTSDYRPIIDLEGVSAEGGMALLRSATGLGWPPKALSRGFDPATFEGLVQLGELWTHHKAGAIERITSMGTMVVHHLESIPEQLRSAFRARITEKGTIFDFILATEDGDLVAELREVQFDTPGL